MHMHMQDQDKIPVLRVPHQKKSFAKYRRRTYSWWQIALIPIVSSRGMTYANVVSVPANEHNRYMTYITTHLPSGAHVFNAAWIALHTSRERIHVLRKRPQDIPKSPRPRCAVMASRTIDTQPLPHDRDCPQVGLVLRGWVRDSHHPVGGYLPSYLFVGASLQKSNL
jgi:hypothetical protein